ncbi:hypothetical protein [Altererythrobacter sp. C41]|uniref:hypothetical protein n=1 Tax=Altererythrobacter sp. C41 TaxID=2806021 RepID=UPI001931D3C8|nr:hypothetical protein [Altererythrobacter sp. C41]MBM0169163.1 hypothetical protein [Altererythrobacter sp. C41]
MANFEVGRTYTREQVADRIGLPELKRKGGAWATGYSRWGDEVVIFCNVGTAGRTGHDYPNRWNGKLLDWTGKTGSTAHQPLIREMLSGSLTIHVFWRGRDRSPFTYAGIASAVSVRETVPVAVTWAFQESGDTLATQEGTDVLAEEPATSRSTAFRRGPRPSMGERTLLTEDGPTSVYLMRLDGPVSVLMPHIPAGHAVIKVGMSNAPRRRRVELNNGFPPGSAIKWRLAASRKYPSAMDAFEAEGVVLEGLRLNHHWIGGEFACLPESEIPEI